MKLATSLAFPLAVFGAFAPWAVAQDTPIVEGLVVNKVTGAGIEGAIVQFHGASAALYEAHTDAAGSFRITGVKPGDYIATVEKIGYVFADNELGYFDRPRHHVNSGGDPLRVRFELNPPAALRGRVIGADGNPARASVDIGRGKPVSTDAEGSFVFENLEPGRYTLLARTSKIETVSQDGTRTAVVPTYYPSVVDRTQAESIIVRAGTELSAYEIRLRSVPVYRVRGVVLNPDGTPAAKAVVQLRARSVGVDRSIFAGGPQSFSIRTGPLAVGPSEDDPAVTGDDGAFEFPSVRAGDWMVHADGDRVLNRAQRRVVLISGSASFSLGRGDPDALTVRLGAPFDLSGAVALADGPLPSRVVVTVSLISENAFTSTGTSIKESGILRLEDVVPGVHEIRASVMGGNYYADSIWLGSSNITGQAVELTPASPPLKVILKPAGTLRGTIEDADKGTIVLFPPSVTGIAYSVQSGVGKTFELGGIPPGSYSAIALDHFDSRTMADAVRLRSLMPMSTSVTVEQGSSASVQLKVHHLAD